MLFERYNFRLTSVSPFFLQKNLKFFKLTYLNHSVIGLPAKTGYLTLLRAPFIHKIAQMGYIRTKSKLYFNVNLLAICPSLRLYYTAYLLLLFFHFFLFGISVSFWVNRNSFFF